MSQVDQDKRLSKCDCSRKTVPVVDGATDVVSTVNIDCAVVAGGVNAMDDMFRQLGMRRVRVPIMRGAAEATRADKKDIMANGMMVVVMMNFLWLVLRVPYIRVRDIPFTITPYIKSYKV